MGFTADIEADLLALAQRIVAAHSPTATAIMLDTTTITYGTLKNVLGIFGVIGSDLDAAVAAHGKSFADDVAVGDDILNIVADIVPSTALPIAVAEDILKVAILIAPYTKPADADSPEMEARAGSGHVDI